MLRKDPKPQYRKYILNGAKVFFAIEAVLLAASYGVWYRMNNSRDFRLYMHNNHSLILNGYYKTGEMLSSNSQIRELDMKIWLQEGKISRDV